MPPVHPDDEDAFAARSRARAHAACSASARLRARVALAAAAAADWIQHAQRERGWSNRLLTVGDTAARAGARRARADADAAWQHWQAAIDALGATADAAPWLALWRAVADMAAWHAPLRALRAQVLGRAVGWQSSTSQWTAAIAEMLHVQAELGWMLGETVDAARLAQWLTLLRYKELCGQERAVGSALLAEPALDDAQRQWLASLVERQGELHEALVRAGVLARADAQPWWPTLQRLREELVQGTPSPVPTADRVAAWFEACTQRIDALHTVEQHWRDHLWTGGDGEAPAAAAQGSVEPPHVELLRALRQRLADQRWIDRAKARLIAHGASEAQAHHRLRRLAMDRRLTYAQAARWVVLGDGT